MFDIATLRIERQIDLDPDYSSGAAIYNQTYEVHKSDQTGDDLVVQSSTDIDPNSLGLNGSTLSWTCAGEQRSATVD